ncbi:MAG TPA: restriction endonuclease subunit S, partial [Candidatus Megamonas gallistercoris]|nr:restriction endonuclease subunit S [Candidatus Megamonas gallistercoris]
YDMGVLSTLYIIFVPNNNLINSKYLTFYYETTNWYKQIAEKATEGARNHGLLNISADNFFDTNLNITKNLDEQKKIGEFFQNLDKLITLHQRKSFLI